MATRPTDTPVGTGSTQGRRVLVVANEVVGGDELVEEVSRRVGDPDNAEVMIVSPALVDSPLDLVAGDVDDDIEAARRRLQISVEALRRKGIQASGEVGEAEPGLAILDALVKFPADEVIIVAHPDEDANWLEKDVLGRARRELTIPITHIEVEPRAAGPSVKQVQEDPERPKPDERQPPDDPREDSSPEKPGRRPADQDDERVDREAEETFPASDPPANY